MVLVWILISTFLISLISSAGILTLAMKERLLKKMLLTLVALSAGVLMGSAFLHLIPEALEISRIASYNIFLYILIGFILFFLMEKLLYWHHCHVIRCPIHTFAYMNLFGDSIHNFVDGLIIAASFVADIHLGIITALVVALHEIPQEIGDFGVLVHGGFAKIKALFLNFICALAAVFGGIFGFFLFSYVKYLAIFLIPFAAGGFIYIAASDLIPEIRREAELKRSLTSFLMFIVGILIMFSIKFVG